MIDPGSSFPPIESLAFLSDGVVTALVAPDGTVEWMCLPRMDAPSVFGAILDRGAGHFRVGPVDGGPATERRYLEGSLVLQSTWVLDSGTLVVTDALATDASGQPLRALVRHVQCLAGSVAVVVECEPRPDYGRGSAADAGLIITTDLATGGETLPAGDERAIVLTWDDRDDPPDAVAVAPADARRCITTTQQAWQHWLARGTLPTGRFGTLVERSALVLKGLIHAPTGAPTAATTTSLPEAPGGNRNWDYRYAWIRDGVCTLAALQRLGFHAEATAFLGFVMDRMDASPLQVMYGVDGATELPESTLDHLTGYEGARPVRIGNGAVHQRQNDMWGWLAHLIERDLTVRDGVADDRTWRVTNVLADGARESWRQPDQGIWEARGAPLHYGSSKVMAWVAMDRCARIAERQGADPQALAWRAEAAAIKTDLLAHGVDDRGVLTQTYGAPALDASLLLAVLMDLLPGDDPRARATVLAVSDELTEGGLVLRYRPDATDDGVSMGEEGTFTICSFWLVSALARIGEVTRARELLERLASFASPLGIYAEELDPATGRHWGNTPQAFSHLALIDAVVDLEQAEQRR